VQYDVKTKKLPKSEVEMEVSLPAIFLDNARRKALKMLAISLEIPGFRKGHVPENVVTEKVGEAKLLEEAVNILLKEHFHKIVAQEGQDIIGQPKISITKLAIGNPVEFKAICAILPVFELPDYKKIAASSQQSVVSENTEATDKEIEDVLLQIRRNKAHFDYHKNNLEDKGHQHPEIKDEDLPELNNEFAKVAGNFKNLDELKGKVKQNITEEKKNRNIEKKRAAIMDELVKNTKIDLPEILIESEIEKSLAQMKNDIERSGGKFADYLAHVKKTEEDLKKDLRESSEKKAKIQLIFNKIAVAEKLEPNKEILENEVKEILKHYPEATEQNARIYVSTILLNQEILKLLEKAE